MFMLKIKDSISSTLEISQEEACKSQETAFNDSSAFILHTRSYLTMCGMSEAQGQTAHQ